MEWLENYSFLACKSMERRELYPNDQRRYGMLWFINERLILTLFKKQWRKERHVDNILETFPQKPYFKVIQWTLVHNLITFFIGSDAELVKYFRWIRIHVLKGLELFMEWIRTTIAFGLSGLAQWILNTSSNSLQKKNSSSFTSIWWKLESNGNSWIVHWLSVAECSL